MPGWLERIAKQLHRKFHVYAAVLVTAAAVLLLSDHWTHWIEHLVPLDRIGRLGESIGKGAFLLGFAATLYYGVRDLFATARKMRVPVSGRLDSFAKYWITVLRLAHPLLGVLVLAVVTVHGYVMWRIWAGGNFSFAVETGLMAAAILSVVAVSGLCVRWLPKMYKLRHVHRLVGLLFVLSFIIHRIVAD